MGRGDSVTESMTHHQTKKKRVEDQPPPSDAGQRPIQLQRRRVWRACESCRCVSDSYLSMHPPTNIYAHRLLFSAVEKRSNAMVTSQLVLSALRRDRNVLGYRRKTERR